LVFEGGRKEILELAALLAGKLVDLSKDPLVPRITDRPTFLERLVGFAGEPGPLGFGGDVGHAVDEAAHIAPELAERRLGRRRGRQLDASRVLYRAEAFQNRA